MPDFPHLILVVKGHRPLAIFIPVDPAFPVIEFDHHEVVGHIDLVLVRVYAKIGGPAFIFLVWFVHKPKLQLKLLRAGRRL